MRGRQANWGILVHERWRVAHREARAWISPVLENGAASVAEMGRRRLRRISVRTWLVFCRTRDSGVRCCYGSSYDLLSNAAHRPQERLKEGSSDWKKPSGGKIPFRGPDAPMCAEGKYRGVSEEEKAIRRGKIVCHLGRN